MMTNRKVYRQNCSGYFVQQHSVQRGQRRAMTMVELTATMAANGVLLTGLVASILMSQKSLQITASQQQGVIHQRQSIEQLRTDLREATRLENTDTNTLTLTVPDRNGDNTSDTVTYTFPTDGSATINRVANSVTTPYQMGTVTRTNRLNYFVPTAPTPPSETILKVTGFTSALSNSAVNSLVVPSLPNTLKDDLLVLVIAADATSGTFTLTSGPWNSVQTCSGNGLQLCIHARVAIANEAPSVTVTCSNSIRMSAAIIRLSGHNGRINVPILFNTASNSNRLVVTGCPTSTNNSIVFRFLAARDKNCIPNFTGLSNNNNLLMRAGDNSSNAITFGIGYVKLPTLTGAINDRFILTMSENYVGASIAIGALQK